VVAFLQQSDPGLLKATAGVEWSGATVPLHRSLRPLWLTLAVLLMLTPVGILAAGSAWGEWVASDFTDAAARQQIASASLQQAPPERAPQGIERLGSLWTAPFARYAPPYVRSATFGYLLSAMFGAGMVMLTAAGVSRFTRRGGST
jgi:cobalt/nickel transport system permease protein